MSTREDAADRARIRDEVVRAELRSARTEEARRYFNQIRAYLSIRADEITAPNDVYVNMKLTPPDRIGTALINYGPTIDSGDTASHFHFANGGRLSFGITIRALDRHTCEILSYRFHLVLGNAQFPSFLRFDLNHSQHEDPLREPQCHVHPGNDDLRVPMAPLTPLEVLDRIFFSYT